MVLSRKIKGESMERRQVISRSILSIGIVMLLMTMFYAVTIGSSDINIRVILDSILDFNPLDQKHLIVREIRIPRVISSAFVGAALAVAGAVMQGITVNPMADSGLMGLNSGAGFALALSFAFFPKASYVETILICFVGAAMGAILVNGIANAGGEKASTTRLVLAGAAVNALLTAFSQGIALTFNVSQDIMFWMVGGVSASNWTQVKILIPVVTVALVCAVAMSSKISLLALGDEVAKSLGVQIKPVTLICSAIVVVLAGISVSIVGAVGFVGLIVPHITRFLVGAQYSRIIPCAAVLGAFLLVLADMGAKTLNPPAETPIGALIALIGVPFFLYLSQNLRR